VDPYQAWELQEVLDSATGALYEVDLLVLGRYALYLIEIKSHPGTLTGDIRDWCIRSNRGEKHIENPLFGTERKARNLASMLKRHLDQATGVWVEPLVFLSSPELTNQLPDEARSHITWRQTIIRALTHHEFPGANPPRRIVDRPTMRAVAAALHRLGLRPSQAVRRVGEYRLDKLLDEGEGYQEHLGIHAALAEKQVRIRSYLVPRATSTERRAQLERAAHREAEVLTRLGEHPAILRCLDYVESAPLGPALIFEAFKDSLPLEVFLRRTPALTFDDRLAILQQIAEALHYCHEKDVLHRNLCPSSVLVRRREGHPLEVRLHSFQVAMRGEGSLGTVHLTGLGSRGAALYLAPEVLDDPAKATRESDLFSIGAVAYFLLSGRHPAETLGDRERLLHKEGGLRISAVRDDLSPGIDECIALATQLHPVGRADHAMEWFGLLEEQATSPQHEPTPDPSSAEPGAVLEGDYTVVRILGAGSTARALQVTGKDGGSYVLKVPHHDGCVDRLRAEAAAMEPLRHQHIVRCHGMRRIGGRECLLLDYAGKEHGAEDSSTVGGTLNDLLREEGTVGLDLAQRFGDDLLSAVQYLEEQGVQHRDIKPANIGFSDPKKARHLKLLDFSLSALAPDQVSAGTPAYRDPGLRQRGRWDPACDRWSVAVTLHEMLTGVRPALSSTGAASIEAERFEPGLREPLQAFFARALAASPEDRFVTAEAMRTAWVALFASPRPVQQAPATSRTSSVEVATPRTPIEALGGLSARARNALDRAGVATVADLLQLPQNHLSAVRGVGRKVAEEIVDLARLLRERLAIAPDPEDAFAPTFRGPKLALQGLPAFSLSAVHLERLQDGGILTTADLASASAARIARVLGPEEAVALRARLTGQLVATDGHATVRRWLDELFWDGKAKLSKGERQVRILCGLDPLPGEPEGAPWALRDILQVAEALDVTRQAIHISLGKARQAWAVSPALASLIDACRGALAGLGGAATVEELAELLAQAHGEAPTVGPELRRRAAALCRLAVEARTEDGRALAMVRCARHALVTLSGETLAVLDRLGEAADELAEADPLPSPDSVRSRLSAIVHGTALSELSPERLVAVAAAAGAAAAPSARLELYPTRMPAARALRLSAAVLSLPGLRPEDIAARVRARYPEAEPLPGRPEIDALLAEYGVSHDPSTNTFVRPGLTALPISSTVALPTMMASATPSAPRLQSPTAMEAASFEERLKAEIETGRFRVLQVRADLAERVARRLAERFELTLRSFDHLLEEKIRALMAELEIPEETVVEADRAGARQEGEPLHQLVHEAATRLVAELLAHPRAQLLVHPGSLATYDLRAPLQELVERCEYGNGSAILMLVPSHEDGGGAAVNGRLPIPVPPKHVRVVPTSWLRGEHRAGASS
jgi:serine/threonine protein kinase